MTHPLFTRPVATQRGALDALRASRVWRVGTLALLGTLTALHAQAQQAAAGQSQAAAWTQFLPLIIMIAALYFIMIRPQMKRQKEHRAMLEKIAVGDEVVAAGGVLGRVTKLGDAHLHIEVANGVELQVQRGTVATVLPKGTLKK